MVDKVALIAGSRSYSAYEDRKAGFLSVVYEMFELLAVVGLREPPDGAGLGCAQIQFAAEAEAVATLSYAAAGVRNFCQVVAAAERLAQS